MTNNPPWWEVWGLASGMVAGLFGAAYVLAVWRERRISRRRLGRGKARPEEDS